MAKKYGVLPDISKNETYEDVTADSVREEYQLYESASSEYRYQMAEDWEFYLGSQLSTKQKEYLVSVGQPPESNNKIRPAVEQILANVAAAPPQWHCIPVGKTDSELSWIYSQILDRVWVDSQAGVAYRGAVKSFIVKGLSYLYVYPDWSAENGLGALRIKQMPAESVFVDPNSSLPDFSDAASIIYSDLHTKEHLKNAFPQYADEIEEAKEDYHKNEISTDKYNRDYIIHKADMPDDGHLPKVRKFVRWERVTIPQIRLIDPMTKYTKMYDRDEYEELKKDEKFLMYAENEGVDVKEVFVRRIRETCVIGETVTYDEILPISNYPIAPACNEHASNPYPSGDVRHAKSPQRMLNRTEALIIAHTNATTNFKLIYEDGALDPEELAKWHVPNAIIRANPNALKEGKVKEFVPPSVSSSLYNEKQRYEVDIEQVFGSYKFQQGNPSAVPGTVGEASLIDEAVSRKQNWKILPVFDCLTILGKVAVEWIPYVYDQQRMLRLVNPLGDEKEVQINLPVDDHTQGVIRIMNDVVTADVDVEVVVGSTKAKNPMADLQRDIGLMQAGIYDKEQVILNMQTDVDKGALIQRMGTISQLTNQVQQLSAQLKTVGGDLQTRERELFHANMRAEVSEATKGVQEAVTNVRANEKLEKARQRDVTRIASKEARDMVNSIKQQPQKAKAGG